MRAGEIKKTDGWDSVPAYSTSSTLSGETVA